MLRLLIATHLQPVSHIHLPLSFTKKRFRYIHSISTAQTTHNSMTCPLAASTTHLFSQLWHAAWWIVAAYATPGLNQAYESGDAAQIASARARELRADAQHQIEGFTEAVRDRITEFLKKVPP